MKNLPTQQICPNSAYESYGNNSDIAVHNQKLKRLRGRVCGKTRNAHHRELHFGLRTDTVKVRKAVDMLSAGISIRKIARLINVSAVTVMRLRRKLDKFN